MMPSTDFSPPWWLRNAHVQTVWGRLVRPRHLAALRREVLTTPDGDELVLDHLDVPAAPIHFILLHGLEGSSYSVYMQGLFAAIRRHGYSATAINFRSCARDPRHIGRDLPNRRPRFYHSGETSDFDFAVRTLARRLDSSRIVAFGASLGGNALLKWLGEHPGQEIVTAAATVSVPYDLAAGAALLDGTTAGRLYVGRFLASLKKKVLRVLEEFPETRAAVDVDAVLRSRTFRDFDDAATAPLHGFADADDYYARSSSISFLGAITTPTLCVSAEDDPFLPAEVLPRVRAAASEAVEIRTTGCGGHVGFIGGTAPWRCTYWAEELVVEWLIEHATGAAPNAAAGAR